jgi:hypothetical protein
MAALVAAVLAACTTKEPTKTTYYERTINPILTTSCVRTNTGAGCHVADAKGNAFGNLDLTSYDGISKRKDLLTDYGAYGQPALLLKNIDPFQVEIRTYDGVSTTVTTDIKHAGGSILDPTATGYQTIRRWIQNGATANNTGVPPKIIERLPCTKQPPAGSFDTSQDPTTPDFAVFRDQVNPIFNGSGGVSAARCAAGNCHGNGSNSLFLTCGDTPEGLRWNYLAAQEYLAQTAEESELLRRPLAPEQGGAFHEGGVIFQSPADTGYVALSNWANAHGPAKVDRTDPGFVFFAHKVQPILVKKGCMMIQCHSASMFHDYRLHGGSGGSFSLSATRQNYDLTITQMALESDDPNASRVVRKNLYRPEVCGVTGCDKPQGLTHRGGPLLEDFKSDRASPKLCDDAKYDFDNGDLDKIPAYCVILEWLRRERTARNIGPLTGIAYVKRPVGSIKRAQDFDVYSPGADLHIVGAKIDTGVLSTTGGDKSVTASCPGLTPATADIRRPQVSWDGKKIAFAARSSATDPLEIYEMNSDGTGCAKRDDLNGNTPSANGILIHNFDPTYAPLDGGFQRIIFASTRGNLDKSNYDYDGPQRTPADPSKPNSNLYVWEPDPNAPAQGHVKQLTFLLDMERQPFVMTDGRLAFVTEKRAPGFYQLALRRQNLDTGDYHPLYAQRGTIGYPEATQVVELADKDFATIFSAQNQSAAGRLGVFNRSIGIDFTSTNAADYVVDPSVIDPAQPAAPEADFFLHSLRFPDGDPNARYASPAPLPMTEFLVSFGAGDDFDVYTISSTTGQKTKLLGDAGTAEVDAVAIYPRAARTIYHSSLDEPNGTTRIQAGYTNADVHVLDFPVLASLLFQNTPTGRLIDTDLKSFTLNEDLPPTPDVTSAANAGSFGYQDAFGQAYARRRTIGEVPLNGDGSARFSIPGGVPIVITLPNTPTATKHNLPRTQREAMVFAPGEVVHQAFKRDLFGALCAQCHGSISGRPVDTALVPDFVTQASATVGRDQGPVDLNKPPGGRGQPGPAPQN